MQRFTAGATVSGHNQIRLRTPSRPSITCEKYFILRGANSKHKYMDSCARRCVAVDGTLPRAPLELSPQIAEDRSPQWVTGPSRAQGWSQLFMDGVQKLVHINHLECSVLGRF